MEYCLCIIFIGCAVLTSMVVVVTGEYGTPILYCANKDRPAQFNWTLPASASGKVVLVVDPQGRELFRTIGNVLSSRGETLPEGSATLEMVDKDVLFKRHDVSYSEAGNYTCREESIDGPVISNCGQTLHYIEVEQPYIEELGSRETGKRLQLGCRVWVPGQHHSLHFVFEWEKDRQLLPGKNDKTLVFDPLSTSDEGRYTCRVTEQTQGCGSSPPSDVFSLRTLVPPSVFIKRNTTRPYVVVQEHSFLTLTCEVKAAFPPVPPNGFTWTFTSDLSPARQLPLTGDTLTLGPVTRKDSGQYTCLARNDQVFQGNLHITRGIDSINVIIPVPPTVSLRRHQHRSMIVVQEGHHITLTCEVKAAFPPVPPNGFTWTFTSDPSPARQLPLTGDTLTLGPVTRKDSGQYTCLARNDLGYPTTWRHGEDSVTIIVMADTSKYQDTDFAKRDSGIQEEAAAQVSSKGVSPSDFIPLPEIVIWSTFQRLYRKWFRG